MIVFTNNDTPVPVNTDDPIERAARRWWCETSLTRYAGHHLTEDWSDVCDRDNAIRRVRLMLACLRAEGVIPGEDDAA
jgi:hypothetical protein